jgi:uncharacterized membrane protein
MQVLRLSYSDVSIQGLLGCLYSVVVTYQGFRGFFTEVEVVFYHNTTWHHNPEDLNLKYLGISLLSLH